jgi:asparagine N-glycosylation enzyme membrane subunit Stt3
MCVNMFTFFHGVGTYLLYFTNISFPYYIRGKVSSLCVYACAVSVATMLQHYQFNTFNTSLTRVYTACATKGTIERQKTTLLIMKASKESNSLAKFHAQIFFSILRNIPIPTVSNSQRDVTFVMITILAKQWNYFNCLLYLCSNTH